MTRDRHRGKEAGVSLIVVLGLLSVLTVLAIAFSRSMREGRLTSRSYADQVRAEALAQVALIRAMEDVNSTMQGCTYPYWNPADALSSGNPVGAAVCSLLVGEATNFIPRALWEDATNAAGLCRWTNIVSEGGSRTNGRIAYLVVNCSGLLDANVIGKEGTPVAGLDPSLLPDITNGDPGPFFSGRADDVRYETIAELAKLNTGVTDPVSNLFIYSYDPGRDVYFTETNDLGRLRVSVTNKLCINDFASTNYGSRLTNLLSSAGFTYAADVASNIVNYLDADRIPQTDSSTPWLDAAGSEAVPLINEIVLQENPPGSTNYQFIVELWFPFAPACVTLADNFFLHTEVYCPTSNLLFDSIHPILSMEYGRVGSEFLTFTTPSFCPTESGSNVPISMTHPVEFLAKVVISDGITTSMIDQAMGSSPVLFTAPASLSVNDPRDNGRPDCWTNAPMTLGATNTVCDPWANGGQGVPIIHRDGPMDSIGELGYTYVVPPWQSVNLMTYDGGHLLDQMTVRDTNTAVRGLVSVSTRQRDVLRTLFAGTSIGYTNSANPTNLALTDIEIDGLAGSFAGPYLNLGDCFESVGSDPWFTSWAPDSVHANGDLKEDALRNIVETITFRQNIFTIIVAAQAFGPDGQTPVSEKRAVAIIYRDSYTGQYFTRFQKWITR